MTNSNFKSTCLIVLLWCGAITTAYAQRVTPLPKYMEECASCHIAYPAGMLPAASWKHTLDTLDKHYGVDASLDAATAKELSTWLVANAGTYRRVSEVPPEHRITKSNWFVRQHHEVSPAVWTRKSVGSPSNCAACHGQAEQGNFSEHAVRIPK